MSKKKKIIKILYDDFKLSSGYLTKETNPNPTS